MLSPRNTGLAANKLHGKLVQTRYLFHEGGFYLGVGSFAACDPAHVRRIDARLVGDSVVNPAVFRDQMGDVLRSVAPAIAISVTVMCRSHRD